LGHYFIYYSLQTYQYHQKLHQQPLQTTDSDPAIASNKLQTNLVAIESWLAKWRMKANGPKSAHITFTMRRGTWPPVHISNVQLPQT
jgi:hypothetical protein